MGRRSFASWDDAQPTELQHAVMSASPVDQSKSHDQPEIQMGVKINTISLMKETTKSPGKECGSGR